MPMGLKFEDLPREVQLEIDLNLERWILFMDVLKKEGWIEKLEQMKKILEIDIEGMKKNAQ